MDGYEQVLQGDIGKIAMMATLLCDDDNAREITDAVRKRGYLIVTGKVGSMDPQKVVASIESAAKKSALVDAELYREQHALYHAIVEALFGISRGQISFGSVLRTVGLRFTVLRGLKSKGAFDEQDWIAVAAYGTMGAPVRGAEHEVMGFGMNHI